MRIITINILNYIFANALRAKEKKNEIHIRAHTHTHTHIHYTTYALARASAYTYTVTHVYAKNTERINLKSDVLSSSLYRRFHVRRTRVALREPVH